MTSLWWIRRDLSLSDNSALHATLEAGPVLPVFLLDPAFAQSSPRRRDFLFEGLHALDRSLRSCGSYLVIRQGDAGQPLVERDPGTTLLAYRLAKETMHA